MFNTGDRVRDRLSGLEGTVIAITEYLYSCRRVCFQPDREDGATKIPDPVWVDEPQAELVKASAFVAEFPASEPPMAARRTGGGPDAPGRADPTR